MSPMSTVGALRAAKSVSVIAVVSYYERIGKRKMKKTLKKSWFDRKNGRNPPKINIIALVDF